MNEIPILRFGIVGDTQYSDIEDGMPFDRLKIRHYRQSLEIFEKAVDLFAAHHINCCILLGDILDGKCSKYGNQEECLSRMINLMNKYDNQDWHISFGNHDFYNFSRDRLLDLIPKDMSIVNNCTSVKLYHQFCPCKGIKFIILDPFEISTFAAISSNHLENAHQLLKEKNKNISIPNSDWSDGLSEEDQKYVPYNGSLTEEQLSWLRLELQNATDRHERVFIFSHVAVCTDCVRPSGLVWNHKDVLEIIQSYSSTVAAVIAGHDHNGGYAIDRYGIHHIVLPAPLECDLEEVAFGYISVYEHHFDLTWFGQIPSVLTFPWPTFMDYPSLQKPRINMYMDAECYTSYCAKYVIRSVTTDEKIIALTFDDGPHQILTPRLLDVLKRKKVQVTFFVMGVKVKIHPEIVKRALEEGHEIANHAYNHPVLAKLNATMISQQIKITNQAIFQATNFTPSIMRPPYGNTNPRTNEYIFKTEKLKTILWSLDTLDWKRPPIQSIIDKVIKKVKPGDIILCHDIHPGTIEAIDRLIDVLRANDYRFATVSYLSTFDELKKVKVVSA